MRRKGFTLLELITVVIIIAILAMIALPQFFKVAERARASEGVSALGAIRSAQFRYYAEHAKYTNSLDDLDVDMGDLKYFDANAVHVNQKCANIQRDTDVSYSGNTAYVLNIDYESGNITCKSNEDMCKKIGYEYSE